MSVSIIVATVVLSFYLFQYISEKEQADKEEERFFQELMNGEHQEEVVIKERKCLEERTNTTAELVYGGMASRSIATLRILQIFIKPLIMQISM